MSILDTVLARTPQAGPMDPGVDGNRRLTAATGAVIFLLLAVEGVTVLSVERLLTLHAFVGMILVPIVVLKIGTTTYRFVRYYLGQAAYVRKGAPHPVLRALGPLVTVLTVALLGTGIVLIVGGRSYTDPWRQLHKLAFIAWFIVMTVHVVGHIVETARLAPLDWTPPRGRFSMPRGVAMRRAALGAALIAGIGLGLATRGPISDWRNERGTEIGGDHQDVGAPAHR